MGSSDREELHALLAFLFVLEIKGDSEGGFIFDMIVACFYSLAEMRDEDTPSKRFRSYRRDALRTWENSPWYTYYLCRPLWWYEDPYNDRHFRNCFRMSWRSFQNLLAICRVHIEYDEDRRDAIGRQVAGLDIMLLAFLAYAGDTIKPCHFYTCTNLKEAVHYNFFRQFCLFGRNTLHPLLVRCPSTADEFEAAMSVFKLAGFPGCLGAMDCTHVRLWKCPASLYNAYKGKEGYPSLVFQVVVDGQRRVLSSSRGFQGSFNDKQVTQRDVFAKKIAAGVVGRGVVKWATFDADNNEIEHDGGYMF